MSKRQVFYAPSSRAQAFQRRWFKPAVYRATRVSGGQDFHAALALVRAGEKYILVDHMHVRWRAAGSVLRGVSGVRLRHVG